MLGVSIPCGLSRRLRTFLMPEFVSEGTNYFEVYENSFSRIIAACGVRSARLKVLVKECEERRTPSYS